MKTYVCITPAHECLLEEYFRPSLPSAFDLKVFRIDLEGRGDFYSNEFLECIRRKIRLIIATIIENQGEVILWSDVDIVFVKDCIDDLSALVGNSEADLYIQREGTNTPELNAGFIIIRCNARSLAFYERLSTILNERTDVNEQSVMNQMLADPSGYGIAITVEGLPFRYYARTQGWPPPRDLYIYHANMTGGANGIAQKCKQFRELHFIRKFGEPARILSCLKRIPNALRKKLTGK